MRHTRLLAAILFAVLAFSARAGDDTLLIQMEKDGSYKVWHIEGDSNPSQDELLALEGSATPEGGPLRMTAAGMARAFEVAEGIAIEIPGAPVDKRLLMDRDACGGVKVWHSAGATQLTDDQLTELVLAAEPGGGKRVNLGKRYAKTFSTRIGVIAVLWDPTRR